MDIDPARFQKLVKAVFDNEKLTAADAATVVGIGRLAVDADRKEDADELDLYDKLADLVCGLAGTSAAKIQDAAALAPRGDDDRSERMKTKAAALTTRPARELAFAVAYVLTIADLDIAPAEHKFLDALQSALGIDDERVEELAGLVTDAIVPG